MSERMIEQRKKLVGLPINPNPSLGISDPPNGSTSSTSVPYATNGTAGSVTATGPGQPHGTHLLNNTTTTNKNKSDNPSQNLHPNATDPLLEEDQQLQCFLRLLSSTSSITPPENDLTPPPPLPSSSLSQHRRNAAAVTSLSSSSAATTRTESTVPIALSRRILNRHSVGYLDQTVSAIVSGAADRFLATVLHQSIACQDRRLNGEKMARKEERERRRIEKRKIAERKARRRKRRRKEKALEESVKKGPLSATLGQLEKGGSGGSGSSAGGAKGKKKSGGTRKGTHNNGTNEALKVANVGVMPLDKGFISEDDSVDEEQSYYENFYGETNSHANDTENESDGSYDEDEFDDDDESDVEVDEVLQLRDIVRPLEAWGISLTGKMGLNTDPIISKSADVELNTETELETDVADATEQENSDDGDDDDDEEDQEDVVKNISTPKPKTKTPAKRKSTSSSSATKASNGKKRPSSPKTISTATPKGGTPPIGKGATSSNTTPLNVSNKGAN